MNKAPLESRDLNPIFWIKPSSEGRGLYPFFWSYENLPEEGTVKAHIRSLRQKLKAVGAPDDLIQTARGLGYCLKQLSRKKILSPESTH